MKSRPAGRRSVFKNNSAKMIYVAGKIFRGGICLCHPLDEKRGTGTGTNRVNEPRESRAGLFGWHRDVPSGLDSFTHALYDDYATAEG